MASEEFEALRAQMAAAPPPPADETLADQRARIDRTMSALPLAEGVTATQLDADGVVVVECVAEGSAPGPTLLYAHGGGFRLVSAAAYRSYGSHLAAAVGGRVVLVDYRLAPEHPFPVALDDMLGAYRWLLSGGTEAADVVVAGDSAGGNLAAATVLALAATGEPAPAGVVCCCPWVDLTNEAESYATNAELDGLFSLAAATEAADMYLGPDGDRTDPLVSPVFGDWGGAPPLLIQASAAEVLVDDAARLARVAGDAGVEVTHHVYPEMPHVWQISYPAFPEAVAAVDEIAGFVRTVVGPRPAT